MRKINQTILTVKRINKDDFPTPESPMSNNLNTRSLKYKHAFVPLFYMNNCIWLSQTTYYSELLAVVLLTGSMSDLWLMFDVSVGIANGIDMSSVAMALNACSILVESFADVSTYEIPNESANSYKKRSRDNSWNFSYLLHTWAFSRSTILSVAKSHLLPTNNFFISLFACWSISCSHILILSNDSWTIIA